MSAEYSVDYIRAMAETLRFGDTDGDQDNEAADMLTAFAERIEADKSAVPEFYYRRDVDRWLLSIEINEYNSWAKYNRPEDAYSPAFTRPPARAAQEKQSCVT